jgi:hypothetical protein
MSKPNMSEEDVVIKNGDEKLEHSNYPTVSGDRPKASVFGLLKDGRM